MKTPEQRAQNVVKRLEDEGFVGDGIRFDRENFLSIVNDQFTQAGLDRQTRAECIDALQDLMQEKDYFIS